MVISNCSYRCLNFGNRIVKYCPVTKSLLQVNYSSTGRIHETRCKSTALSYNHTGGTIPLTSYTIGNGIDAAHNYGDKEAVVNSFQGIRKTFTQYINDINRFAAGLLALKLNLGDRIGIWSPNCYEWMVAQHAVSKAGLIMVPISPAYQMPEIDYCIRKVGIKAMVIYDQFKTQDYFQMLVNLMPEINDTKPGSKIKNKNHPYFDTIITMTNKELPGTYKFHEIIQSCTNKDLETLEKIQNQISMDKPVYIMFTSGTTGKPKGVVLSHHNIVNHAFVTRDKYNWGKDSIKSCVVVPLFHTIGCVMLSLPNLINGNTTVLTGPAYNPESALKALQDEKCTDIGAPATIFIDMLNHPNSSKVDLSLLKKARMGGSLCPPPLLMRLIKEWKCDYVATGYGSTELSGTAMSPELDDPVSELLVACGRPVPYMEVKVVDTNGCIVARGQPGEIWARGYKVMLGYWDDEDKTREAITKDGWYRTGDVGIMLESGCIQIVDRIGDMIIRGGENIYPKEIEDFLMEHPKILEAYVFGIPDERMGEEICVWVLCRRGETLSEFELRKFCKGKLAHFKIPRYVRLVQKFPKTLTGKVQKHEMREEELKLAQYGEKVNSQKLQKPMSV
ncbi:hypothetical protein CHUAL_003059 [Chamberlinius hualienensis]